MSNQNRQMTPSEFLILVCGAALLVNWSPVQISEHAFGAEQDSPVLAPVQPPVPTPVFAPVQTPVPTPVSAPVRASASKSASVRTPKQDTPKYVGGSLCCDNTTVRGASPHPSRATEDLLVNHVCDQFPQRTGSTDLCRDLASSQVSTCDTYRLINFGQMFNTASPTN
jgi:hypothetical protein